jgi:Sec-independent protein secretion pathway component TatC
VTGVQTCALPICHAPCPIDPSLRDACLRTRRTSRRVYAVSVVLFAVGAWFAFVQPLLMAG